MSIPELKKELITKIKECKNEDLLAEISTILHVDSRSINGVYQMTDDERAAVEEGIAQIENGQWISNEEANWHIDELLKREPRSFNSNK